MRLPLVLALALCAAPPAWADKRLDEAVAKAEALLAKGKEDEAVKILEKAASQAPRDPEAQLALARMLSTVGKLDDAGAAFGRAGERAAGAPAGVRARVLASRSGFALRAGTAREARTLAEQAVEAERGAESLAALARAQARLGDPAARDTADQAVTATASAITHVARGDSRLAAHLAAEAQAAYARALELAPRSALAGTGLALALAGQGKVSPALAAARAAIQADPHCAEAQSALGLAALAQDPRDKSNDAAAAAQQGILLEPKNPQVRLTVGRVFESRDDLGQAAEGYREAARLDPTWAAPRVAELSLQLRRGDSEGVLAGLRALPDELKSSGEAQLLLGKLLLRKEDSEGAKAALDLAVAALPGLAEAHAAHGTAAYNVGELTQAADAYGRAVAIEPDNLAYLSNHGLFLGYDGRLEEGLAVLLKATGRPDSQDAGAFINLGWIYHSFRPPRVTEAVAAYNQALKIDPKNARAAMGVALSYRAGKQWARAITAYERVSTMDARLNGEALLGTAWCHYRSGDDYKARFFAGLAKKAGADVGPLRDVLLRPVKAGTGAAAAPKAEDESTELVQQLFAKNAGEQAYAVRRLVGLGRPAVPYLATALGKKGTAIAVREAIVDGLDRMGPIAREALPQLDRLIKAGPVSRGTAGSPEERERETRLISAMQAAAATIRGK